jgi:hypothetical protein
MSSTSFTSGMRKAGTARGALWAAEDDCVADPQRIPRSVHAHGRPVDASGRDERTGFSWPKGSDHYNVTEDHWRGNFRLGSPKGLAAVLRNPSMESPFTSIAAIG